MSDSDAPLPPGRTGLPLLGETLALMRDVFGFVETRAKQHGAVFRTRLLGRPTAVIVGPDATAKFIDESDVQREGAMPGNIEALFGGRALPVLDGEEHHLRKRMVMAAFTHDAVAGYVPALAALVDRALERWAAASEVRAADELRRLAIEAIGAAVVGLGPGPELDALRADYDLVLRGFHALPVTLPGSTFARAKQAMKRILAAWVRAIREHQSAPREDGLSRMLAAAASSSLDPEAIAREIHHVVLAGVVVWAWCARAIIELDRNPGVRARLQAEVDAGGAAATPTVDAIEAMTYLDQVANEVRRISPVVPVSFGKARRTFTFAGHTIPAGWMVLWATAASHTRADVYPDPERFDPDRFAAGAPAEATRHPCAFAPNGAGDVMTGHKCAGYFLAPTLLKIFLVQLLRRYTFALTPEQSLDYDWSQIPPPPRDGLRLRLQPR
jgi:cytochrome P450